MWVLVPSEASPRGGPELPGLPARPRPVWEPELRLRVRASPQASQVLRLRLAWQVRRQQEQLEEELELRQPREQRRRVGPEASAPQAVVQPLPVASGRCLSAPGPRMERRQPKPGASQSPDQPAACSQWPALEARRPRAPVSAGAQSFLGRESLLGREPQEQVPSQLACSPGRQASPLPEPPLRDAPGAKPLRDVRAECCAPVPEPASAPGSPSSHRPASRYSTDQTPACSLESASPAPNHAGCSDNCAPAPPRRPRSNWSASLAQSRQLQSEHPECFCS